MKYDCSFKVNNKLKFYFNFRMWINEGFTHFFAFLPNWEFILSKESNVDKYCRLHLVARDKDWNCTCFRTVDENLAFFQEMTFESKMETVDFQGPLYQKGRHFKDALAYIYEWGAMFVRMLEATIGKSQFQMAMQSYMKRNKFKNVDHGRLWSELEFVNPFKDQNVSI